MKELSGILREVKNRRGLTLPANQIVDGEGIRVGAPRVKLRDGGNSLQEKSKNLVGTSLKVERKSSLVALWSSIHKSFQLQNPWLKSSWALLKSLS